jgi:hypothetical protein
MVRLPWQEADLRRSEGEERELANVKEAMDEQSPERREFTN